MLLEENFLHQGAGLNYLWIAYAIKNIYTCTPRHQDALMPHDRQMLGNICF